MDDVVGNYLDSLSEREFDAPFMSLLRGLGFYDIHFLHGAFEWGKDFIAKRSEEGGPVQYAFQSKAGDLDLAAWRLVRGQLDDLRTNALGHSNFDASLPRRAVLVTTGRLVGAAATDAGAYKDHLRSLGEADFETWDRERLVEHIMGMPEVGLPRGSSSALLGLLAAVDDRRVSAELVERHSRQWILPIGTTSTLRRIALEAAVLANRLRRNERLDLAALTALCLLRSAWASSAAQAEPEAEVVEAADVARAMFCGYARELWIRCDASALDPVEFHRAHWPSGVYVAYPARCLGLLETLGLYALSEEAAASGDREAIIKFVGEFVAAQPGASHPPSDRWAVSLGPPAIALQGRPELEPWLEAIAVWLCDHYEQEELGLARLDASPDDEAAYLLGSAFESNSVTKRSESFLAAVLLDLLTCLGLKGLYELAVNDFRAVRLYPQALHVPDDESQYARDGTARLEVNVPYPEAWEPTEGWKLTTHHRLVESYRLERLGRSWDHIAISSVLRDRLFLPSVRALLADRGRSPQID